MRFEFGEGHFNRIEVGAVGGQEQEPATAVSQGLCGGRRAAAGLLWVDRLSRMTTVPGSRAGAGWVSIQVSNAGPLMAPVMTRGAISAFVSARR